MIAVKPIHTVAYQRLVQKGGQQNLPFVKDTESLSLRPMDCKFTKLAHPVCSIIDFDTKCEHALDQKINLIIKRLQFYT